MQFLGRLEFDFVSEQRVGKDDFILNDVRYVCVWMQLYMCVRTRDEDDISC